MHFYFDPMPRRLRQAVGGYVYHVLNRSVARLTVFEEDADYEEFVRVLVEALDWMDVRLLSYCVLPDQWHLVVWPMKNGDLSEFMRWLTVTHTRRWHASHDTQGTGPLYQGRFKSFPVQPDEHCLELMRFVERAPLRARLVRKAARWRYSSLGQAQLELPGPTLHAGPVARPRNWLKWVERPETDAELAALERSVQRGAPFGDSAWQMKVAKKLGLESSMRPIGRPRLQQDPKKK